MYTHELLKLGNKYVPHFVGVFPLNKLPKSLRAPSNFIVNTHTHNLPGEHWLAVSYQKGGILYAFDPFGVYYPSILKIYLINIKRRIGPVRYNKVCYQDVFEKSCGLYCLAWLITINSTR
jgi:hypothetical protein